MFVISKMGKGGAQQITLNLANGLCQSGIQVDLLILFRTPQDKSVLNDLDPRITIVDYFGSPIHLRADHSWSLEKSLYIFSLPFRIIRNVLNGNFQQYNIIHSHLFLASFVSFLADLLLRVFFRHQPKFIETFHADLTSISDLESRAFMKMWTHLDMLVLELRKRDIDIFSTALPRVLIKFVPFGIPAPPTNIDEERRLYLAELENSIFHADRCRIVSVTRLNNADKRVDKLIDVISHLRMSLNIPFEFLLCGDGPDKNIILKQVKNSDLEDIVLFAGYVDDIFEPLIRARAFLIAGIEDQVGIAGLQAASLGVPVVSYQADPDWKTQNSEDVFFHSSSVEELFVHLKRLVQDDDFFLRESSRSKKIINANYSMTVMVSRYIGLYSILLGGTA